MSNNGSRNYQRSSSGGGVLSSSLVQSGGIQAQFNQVNREKEKLRSEKEAFERERLLVEKELQALTAAHEDYTAKIRTAQGKAGRVNAQRSMRQNELHQLTQQKKEERRALEDTAQEVKNCEDQERQRMIDFCQEVNKLTDNFDHLIRQLEGARLMTLICPESVDRLLAIWKEKRSDVLDNAEQIDAKLTNAAKAFKESIEKWNEAHTYNEHLQQQLFAVRQEALSSGKVTEQELYAMEDSWKQTYYDGSNPNDRVPEHMDVFYGADNDASVEMEAGDMQGQDSGVNGKKGESMMQYGIGHANGGYGQEEDGAFDQQDQNDFY